MTVAFCPLSPWTLTVRAYVEGVANDLAELDADEIFGLRPSWADGESLVQDIAGIIRNRALIDGFVALRPDGDDMRPVAVALAYLDAMPHVANVVMFGRQREARAMAEVYREMTARAGDFGPRHAIRLAQVPILADHRTARRRARRSGGREAFDYGPVGTSGQSYLHTIWRF